MMASQWTAQQQLAIETRGGSTVVSAAAGSGKTAVLVERVCHYLIAHQGDLDRLLIVTFTEAAANEMRQRIAAALRTRLTEDPGNQHLARQLALLQRAHISTIHSFCLWLLRRYFYRLELDPAFRVMDDGEDRLLQLEVLEALLEERYQNEPADAPFYALVDRYGDERGAAIERLVLALHAFSESQVFPAVWLQEAALAFTLDPDAKLESLRWYPMLREQAVAKVQGAQAAFAAALRLAEQPGGPPHYQKALLSDIATTQQLVDLIEHGDWDQIVEAFQTLKFTRAQAPHNQKSADIDDTVAEQVKALRQSAKDDLDDLKKSMFARSSAQMLADLRSLATPAAALSELVTAFGRNYLREKQARGLVNFADLERYTLQLLLSPDSTPQNFQPSPTALELQEQFSEVLCDEYQDINQVQDAILSLVAGEYGGNDDRPGTFMVGDVKQSIYRFRLAEPRIFLERCRCSRQNAAGKFISLAANFRCRQPVVDGVNFLFSHLMSTTIGDVDYNDEVALVHHATYPPVEQPEPVVEAVFLEGDPHLIDDARRLLSDGSGAGRAAAGNAAAPAWGTAHALADEESADADAGEARVADGSDDIDPSALEREAAYIARRIRGMVAGGGQNPYLVWDKDAKCYRPVRYRDIVVLLRATQVKASQFIDIFRSEGVPLYAETGRGYFQAPEVETMLALLSIIDNPRQDLPLAGVLRSPLVGLDAAQLAQIRLAAPDAEFYDAVAAYALHDDELGSQLAGFLAQLDTWRTKARRSTLAELVWSLYRDTSYYDYCGGLPGGNQRQANLRALYDRARQFDQFARHGLLRFLQFIADLRSSGADLGTAPALGENEDVVRLMSIHKSKGLEFPVVFVAGLGTRFNQQDLTGTLLFDRELGYGPQVVDPVQHTRAHTLASMGVRESIRRAGLSEEMRILYVALTRARERLFLVGTVRDVSTSAMRWRQAGRSVSEQKRLPFYLATAARSYTDWIGPVLASCGELVPEVPVDGSSVITTSSPGWQVSIWPPVAVVQAFCATKVTEPVAATLPDHASQIESGLSEEFRLRLERQLSWTYRWAEFGALSAKTTVTELKRREAQELDPENPSATTHKPPVFRRPAFVLDAGKLSATEIGTATHLVLQHLPLTSTVVPADIAACIERLVSGNYLTGQEGAAIDQQAIMRFLQDPIGQRLLAAARRGSDQVLREVPFSLAIPVAELPGNGSSSVDVGVAGALADGAADAASVAGLADAGGAANVASVADAADVVIIQGVIDCLFREPDGWILLDFKTDRLAVADLESAARERYSAQVRWYARAAAQVLGIPIIGCYLYMLAHSTAVEVSQVKNNKKAG